MATNVAISLDSNKYDVLIEEGTLYRTFELASGTNAGEAISGKRIDDIIGTRTTYRLNIRANPQAITDYANISGILNEVESQNSTHDIFIGTTAGSLIAESEALISASEISFEGVKSGVKRWSGVELVITPKAPQIRVNHNEIDFDGGVYNDTALFSATESRETSLDKSTLGLDTAEVEIKSATRLDTGSRLFAPILINRGNRYFLTDVKRTAADRYKLVGLSSVGRLKNVTHLGGIYNGEAASTVISEICGDIPVIVDADFAPVQLYGYLPPTSDARNNLAQVLFAIGASLRTEADGTLHVTTLSSTPSGTFTADDIFTGASINTDAAFTDVIVYEHAYTPGNAELILFSGTTTNNQLIVFSEPAHSLTATGFSIISSGANYAVVSAGVNGELRGYNFEHSTRAVRGEIIPNAPLKNEKTVYEATLVSSNNVNQVVSRLMSYYACREHIVFNAISNGEQTGDVLSVYHPFEQTQVVGTLESVSYNASAIKRGNYRFLVGFIPPETPETFTHEVILTGSGSWTVPAGVTRIRRALIGGGSGGSIGGRGADAVNPEVKSFPADHIIGVIRADLQAIGCAEGGKGGEGGRGGLVNDAIINVTPGDTFSFACGSGGAGETSLTPAADGTATTFGIYSSDDGIIQDAPIYSLDGSAYGGKGESGMNGGHGGGFREGSTLPVIAEDIIVEGVTYSPGASGEIFTSIYDSGGNDYATESYGSLGGGNAYKANGNPGAQSSDVWEPVPISSPHITLNVEAGGNGADALAPDNETTPGKGGRGGNGGGGGGQIGFPNRAYTTSSHIERLTVNLPETPGQGGAGSSGSNGAPGVIIIQY